jgi:hypothetical protein
LPGIVDRHMARGDPPVASPVLASLIAGLAPRQRPVLRLGGDSADQAYLTSSARTRHRIRHCPFRRFALSPGIIGAVGALARSLDASLILGLNLKAHEPSMAATEAAVLTRALDPVGLYSFIDAFELGNEPDLYPLYSSAGGFDQYLSDFGAWAAAARAGAGDPRQVVAGPSLGRLGLPWITGTAAVNWQRFIHGQATPQLLTFHFYPLLKGACPGQLCPSIPNLLADGSSHGLAESVAPFVAATPPGAQVRVDEMNSATGEGAPGVSDTFASALWALDALFEFEAAGVSGVNVQTIPGAPYALFDRLPNGSWVVRPEYYGLATFALASPPGSQLLSVTGGVPGVKVWATRSTDGRSRIVVVNKDLARQRLVLYGPATHPGRFTVARLLAPANADSPNCAPPYLQTGMCATAGVTLGARSFGARAAGPITGDQTTTGALAPPLQSPLPICAAARQSNCALPGPDGAIFLTVPAASAALITAR